MRKRVVTMGTTIRHATAGMGAAAILALNSLAVSAEPSGDAYKPSQVIFDLDQSAQKTLLPTHPAIGDALNTVVGAIDEAGASKSAMNALKSAARKGRAKPMFVTRNNDSEIEVYIATYNTAQETIDSIKAAGASIEIVSTLRPLIKAFVPVDGVEDVAELECVREVTLPNYAIPTASGLVTTEGEALTGIPYVRSRGVKDQDDDSFIDGSGVVVGVISSALFTNGTAGLGPKSCGPLQQWVAGGRSENGSAVLSPSDLPSQEECETVSGMYGDVVVRPRTLSLHAIDTDVQDTDIIPYPEGSAMLEVVHDLAPKASLVYTRGVDALDLEANRNSIIRSLTPAPDVVIENLVFVGEGRYDGSSMVSMQAAQFARERNIHYYVSVGGVTPAASNGITQPGRFPMQITDFFRGDPRDNRARVHSWAQGVIRERDEGVNIGAGDNGAIDVTLVWDDFWDDDRPRSKIDFDLYLVPRDTLALSQAVSASVRIQNGVGSNPRERLIFFPTFSTPPLALVLVRAEGTENSRTLFTLVIESGEVKESNYLTHGVPLNNADALPPVVTVGDIDVTNDFQIATSAIPGRTPGNPELGRFLKWYEAQDAPTVVSYGSVRTRTTDLVTASLGQITDPIISTNFSGPSAAASHVGAFSALLRHRFPEMPTYRLGQILSDTSGVGDGDEIIIPFAKDITPAEVLDYPNHPTYRRTNMLAIYDALDEGTVDPYGDPETKILIPRPGSLENEQDVLVADAEAAELADQIHGAADLADDTDAAGWQSLTSSGDGPSATTAIGSLGLEITAGEPLASGGWRSPLLAIKTPQDDAPRTALRTDRMYSIEARIGSDETDPLRVPDFRLAVDSENGDESWALTIANQSGNADSAPTTLGGRVYQIFFRPTSNEAAAAGFTFLFEMIASEGDTTGATLVLRDLLLRELPLPEDPAALP